ncbi:MAG: hypothetical protein Q9214_007993 [Letrouitia sp. 1 TL-2023]
MDGDAEDEDEIYLKVAEAGQRVLKLYRQLHRVHLVNYTYLATVHLFMAGMTLKPILFRLAYEVIGVAFLYAIWHSATVRSRLTLDDVDFTVLAATSVLGDLIDKCPPAEACRDAFDRMSKATVQMCLSTTGFGSRVGGHTARQQHETSFSRRKSHPTADSQPGDTFRKASRPAPQFDMNLRDLFADELQDGRPFGSNLGRSQASAQSSLTPLQQPLETMKSEQQYTFSPVRPTPPSAFIDSNMNDEPYNTDEFSNIDGLDFLLANDIDVGYHGQSGLNLGFEGQHDWADGTQLDIFDGFFFGGTGYAESGG